MNFQIRLSDLKEVPKKIQLLRVGKWDSATHGKFSITKETLESLKKNFDDKVRGYEDGKLPVDYFHEYEKIAGGWIENLTIEGDGLFADIAWTPKCEQMLKDCELRYVSADLHFNYEDVETKKKYGPTLNGAGLTNIPFVKRMDPITALSAMQKSITEMQKQLSEIKPKEGIKMTIEEAMAKIDELNKKIAELEKKDGGAPAGMADLQKKYDELSASVAKDKVMSEKKEKFNTMLSEGKVCEAQRDGFMSDDMVKFSENAAKINLGGKGKDGGKDKEEKSASDEVLEIALKEKKDVSLVLHENKELADRYAKETAV